jgi:16S rRNA (adenine1518-N6/adenine1519-N6)-dimethyltransferase
VVELAPRPAPLFGELDGREFDAAVKAAFSTRRKTVRNALLAAGWIEAAAVDDVLARAGIDPGLRAERIETAAFAALARAKLAAR